VQCRDYVVWTLYGLDYAVRTLCIVDLCSVESR